MCNSIRHSTFFTKESMLVSMYQDKGSNSLRCHRMVFQSTCCIPNTQIPSNTTAPAKEKWASDKAPGYPKGSSFCLGEEETVLGKLDLLRLVRLLDPLASFCWRDGTQRDVFVVVFQPSLLLKRCTTSFPGNLNVQRVPSLRNSRLITWSSLVIWMPCRYLDEFSTV